MAQIFLTELEIEQWNKAEALLAAPEAANKLRRKDTKFIHSFLWLDNGHVIRIDRTGLEKKIKGYGAFGLVVGGVIKKDEEYSPVAIKIQQNNSATERIDREIKTMKNLGSSLGSCVRTTQSQKTQRRKTQPTIAGNKKVYYCMELFFMSLRSVLKQEDPPLIIKTKLAVNIVKAIETIHKEGYLHGDIKPDNLMLDHNGNIRIIDVEGARSLPKEDTVVKYNDRYQYCSSGTKEYSPFYTSEGQETKALDSWLNPNKKITRKQVINIDFFAFMILMIKDFKHQPYCTDTTDGTEYHFFDVSETRQKNNLWHLINTKNIFDELYKYLDPPSDVIFDTWWSMFIYGKTELDYAKEILFKLCMHFKNLKETQIKHIIPLHLELLNLIFKKDTTKSHRRNLIQQLNIYLNYFKKRLPNDTIKRILATLYEALHHPKSFVNKPRDPLKWTLHSFFSSYPKMYTRTMDAALTTLKELLNKIEDEPQTAHQEKEQPLTDILESIRGHKLQYETVADGANPSC